MNFETKEVDKEFKRIEALGTEAAIATFADPDEITSSL